MSDYVQTLELKAVGPTARIREDYPIYSTVLSSTESNIITLKTKELILRHRSSPDFVNGSCNQYVYYTRVSSRRTKPMTPQERLERTEYPGPGRAPNPWREVPIEQIESWNLRGPQDDYEKVSVAYKEVRDAERKRQGNTVSGRPTFKNGRLIVPKAVQETAEQQRRERRSRKASETRRKNKEQVLNNNAVTFYVETTDEIEADVIDNYANRLSGVVHHASAGNFDGPNFQAKFYSNDEEVYMSEYKATDDGARKFTAFLQKRNCKFDSY